MPELMIFNLMRASVWKQQNHFLMEDIIYLLNISWSLTLYLFYNWNSNNSAMIFLPFKESFYYCQEIIFKKWCIFFPLELIKIFTNELWNLYEYFTALLKNGIWNNIKNLKTLRNLGDGTKRKTSCLFRAHI